MPTMDAEEFLAHHGVKGMKWGKRKANSDSSDSKASSKADKASEKTSKKATKLDTKLSKSKDSIENRARTVAGLEGAISDLRKNGVKSEMFKAQFGDWPNADDSEFNRRFGKSKTQALADFDSQLSSMRNSEAIALNLSTSRNKRLQKKRDSLSHTDLDENDIDELGDVDELDTPDFLDHYDIDYDDTDYMAHYDVDSDDVLMHFGVKGMKWGKRKAGSASASLSNPRREARAQYKADLKSAKKKQSMWTGGAKRGQQFTPAEKAALKKNARRQIAGSLAIYGGIQLASFAAGKASAAGASKLAAEAATKGAQFNTRNMSAIGNLSTFTLRQGANGSWG